MTADSQASFCSRRVRRTRLFRISSFHSIRCSAMSPASASEPSGSWDSIHVFETGERGRTAHYKLTSTIMLHLVTTRGKEEKDVVDEKDKERNEWTREGEVSLSGSM